MQRKILNLILCLCVILLISGCGEIKDSSEKNSSKNNAVQSESKVEQNQDVQVQTSSFDKIDMGTKNEVDDKCLICDNTTWQGSKYCSKHKCSRSGCDDKITNYERYCQYHKCGKSGCGNQNSIDNSKGSAFCSQHTCCEFGCVNQAVAGGYCEEHVND